MACINCFLLVILDHQESLDAQSRELQQAGEEEMEPDQGEDVPPSDELPQVNEVDTYGVRYVPEVHAKKNNKSLNENWLSYRLSEL